MSNSYSLDALRADIEREFAPIIVEIAEGKSVVLRNLLRLPKKDREAAFEHMTSMEKLESEESSVESMEATGELARAIFALVADDKRLGKVLVDALTDDLALTLRLFERWVEATQPGEAQPSLD
ncbi:phage tail assembly protein [Nocardia sp. IFM 10818]